MRYGYITALMSTRILAIETSCDETAAAVIENGQRILSNVVASQIDLHRRYGGVFPELASRQHVLAIAPVIEQALAEAAVTWRDLDALAVTEGPGLAGSLLVGVNAAKGIAFMQGLPLIAVNHLEGHIDSNWLIPQRGTGAAAAPPPQLPFPVLVLIVSGGHTELVLMPAHGQFQRIGGTLDDAAGEAFDKAARLLGLPYPGGPVVQRVAALGDPTRFALPRALTTQPEHRHNFSFSGLKTALLRLVREQKALLNDDIWPAAYAAAAQDAAASASAAVQTLRDIAAGFQAAVADSLVSKTALAAQDFGAAHVCVCGGVAANGELRRQLAARLTLPHSIPPIWLCTDNAAMIGAAAHVRYEAGLRAAADLDVKARWPLRSWELLTDPA